MFGGNNISLYRQNEQTLPKTDRNDSIFISNHPIICHFQSRIPGTSLARQGRALRRSLSLVSLPSFAAISPPALHALTNLVSILTSPVPARPATFSRGSYI